jgi:hypothetical protein
VCNDDGHKNVKGESHYLCGRKWKDLYCLEQNKLRRSGLDPDPGARKKNKMKNFNFSSKNLIYVIDQKIG